MTTLMYDIVVIGGGAGGLTAAKTARGFGKKVAIIEKTDRLGGECTWTGCVPSKALIKVARIAHDVKIMRQFGLAFDRPIAFNTDNVMKHVQSVIRQVYTTHEPSVLNQLGIDTYFGEYVFIDKNRIKSNEHTLYAKKFVITTGSHPFIPSIIGLDTVDYLTNETLFSLGKLPKSMIILGGGAIGAEMAQALSRLGVHITIIEMNDRLLSKEEPELVALLQKQLIADGILIKTSARATQVRRSGDLITVMYTQGDGINGAVYKVAAEKLLVAVGRRPNVEQLGLEKIGVDFDNHGVKANKYMQTTVKNIYAAGDVVGPYQFSHMAWYQAVTAIRNAIIPIFKNSIDYTHKIWVTFTDPELATMGLTEESARKIYGDTLVIYRRLLSQIDRARVDKSQGIVKIICDKKGYIIGAHIVGERAGDIIHELQVAKVFGIKFYKLHKVIHAYPSYAEIIWHMSKQAYVERLQSYFIVKLFKKLFWRT